ncbi:MAG: biopolymer transporter ExbD [Cyanobacteria bacterium J06581_3]
MKVDMNNRESDVQIEILPMIDVIFCILTFFILAAVGLSRQQAIDLALPSVNNSTPLVGDGRERLYVSVDSVGQVYIETIPIQLSELQGYLRQHQQLQPNGTIVLYASSSARYEDVIKVLDLLRSVGGDRVALATLPNGASLDPTQGNSPLQNQQPAQPQPGNLGQPIPGMGSPTVPPDGTSPGGVQVTPNPTGTTPGSSLPPVSGGSSTSPNAPVAPPADIRPATP